MPASSTPTLIEVFDAKAHKRPWPSTESDVQEIVDSYDPTVRSASINFDHDIQSPQPGRVTGLQRVGSKLYAAVEGLSDGLKGMVKAGVCKGQAPMPETFACEFSEIASDSGAVFVFSDNTPPEMCDEAAALDDETMGHLRDRMNPLEQHLLKTVATLKGHKPMPTPDQTPAPQPAPAAAFAVSAEEFAELRSENASLRTQVADIQKKARTNLVNGRIAELERKGISTPARRDATHAYLFAEGADDVEADKRWEAAQKWEPVLAMGADPELARRMGTEAAHFAEGGIDGQVQKEVDRLAAAAARAGVKLAPVAK